jgi:hypothetical protein
LNKINTFKILIKIFSSNGEHSLILYCQCNDNVLLHCGVMKLLADMPSRLGGGDYRINIA